MVGPHEAAGASEPVELGLPEKFNATVQLLAGNAYGFTVVWAWM